MLTPMDKFLMLKEKMIEMAYPLSEVVSHLENNPNLTSEMFEMLHPHQNQNDETILLAHSKLTNEWFLRILKNNPRSPYWLALNPHLTTFQIDTLLNRIEYEKLSEIEQHDTDQMADQIEYDVRTELARHANLNEAQYKQLYDDGRWKGSLRLRLAENPNLTARQITQLADSGEERVQMLLARYSKLTDEMFTRFLPLYPIELSKNSQLTPVQIEAIYSADIVGGERLRGNLAKHSHLTDKMFHKLWEDGWVSSFPMNTNLTSSQGEQVIQDDPHTVSSIANTAQLSDEFFLKLFHYYDDKSKWTTVVNLADNPNLYLTKPSQTGIINWVW